MKKVASGSAGSAIMVVELWKNIINWVKHKIDAHLMIRDVEKVLGYHNNNKNFTPVNGVFKFLSVAFYIKTVFYRRKDFGKTK